ncbi:hypothetical protein NDU88_004644 [Pleurodeles waltl]|uniref:Uncharacterized protein n=1 Tax=Pleurodeles waltl TaxID=8319 RepID=A0AAV7NPX2_PLEWA|nr:hypothetical protein NDU88_004644 [Pleurodeles waltl]
MRLPPLRPPPKRCTEIRRERSVLQKRLPALGSTVPLLAVSTPSPGYPGALRLSLLSGSSLPLAVTDVKWFPPGSSGCPDARQYRGKFVALKILQARSVDLTLGMRGFSAQGQRRVLSSVPKFPKYCRCT